MERTPIKFGLVAVIILEVASIFYFLHVYHDFVSSPENYYRNILVKQGKAQQQLIDE